MTSTRNVLDELRRLEQDPVAAAVGEAVGRAARAPSPQVHRWVGAIESLRADLEASTERVQVALPNRRGIEKWAPVNEICERRSKKRPWGRLLLEVAHELHPVALLELGTCLGISTAYLAAGQVLAGGGRLVTLEGAASLAWRAAANVRLLGLAHVDVRAGLFRDTLAPALVDLGTVDLAFVDGHHDEQATQDYFAQILERTSDDAVVVFDDISWSKGMAAAWRAIVAHPRVEVAVGLGAVGICVIGMGPARRYELATITRLQACAGAPA